jgi:hypothetical protein
MNGCRPRTENYGTACLSFKICQGVCVCVRACVCMPVCIKTERFNRQLPLSKVGNGL